MKVEIREIVATYSLAVFGHTVQARITKGLCGDDDLRWEISHFCRRDGGGKAVMPVNSESKTMKQAVESIREYCEGFVPGYSPQVNPAYWPSTN
jgi:hypothetical protein